MELIRQAIAKARGAEGSAPLAPAWRQPAFEPGPGPVRGQRQPSKAVLQPRHLETERIVAHNAADPRTKPYDMLRTQVLRSMDLQNWQVIGVTSPMPGCGKTLTAINLALSIARQPDRSVLLVDLDLQRPKIARCLGIQGGAGLLGVLEERSVLPDAVVGVAAGGHQLLVLPNEEPTAYSSEWMASRHMSTMLRDIRKDHRSRIVILDLPPILSSDDVITILPQIDCILLVVAVDKTTVNEIEECSLHLQSSDVVRIVLNKSPETLSRYY
jgi:Mrp family chromosome partitioning ATPase